MVDSVIWILIVAMFILSFIGILYPIIPSVIVLLAGFGLYHFGINGEMLGWVFWTVTALFTILLIGADIIANSYFVKQYGGSKWGERAAGIAVIVGSLIIPPFGVLLVPFATVLVVELIQKRTFQDALKASIGSLIGFLSGAFAKVVIQAVMIIIFIIGILV